MEYWIKKLGISHAEFDLVMAEEPRLYSDYPNGQRRVALINSLLRFCSNLKRTVLARTSRLT